MTVSQSPRARRDLVSIHNYIAEENRSRINADRFMERFEGKFRLIDNQPFIRRVRDDLQPGLRCQPFERYLIFYRPLETGIEIVRVLHAARDVEALFH